MKKARRKISDDLRPEYKRSDFGEMVRGKYYRRYTESSNVVVLDRDVAKRFRNAREVNSALRILIGMKPEMRAEYSFDYSKGVRGKYVGRIRKTKRRTSAARNGRKRPAA